MVQNTVGYLLIMNYFLWNQVCTAQYNHLYWFHTCCPTNPVYTCNWRRLYRLHMYHCWSRDGFYIRQCSLHNLYHWNQDSKHTRIGWFHQDKYHYYNLLFHIRLCRFDNSFPNNRLGKYTKIKLSVIFFITK